MAVNSALIEATDGRPNRRAITEWTTGQLYERIFSGELAPAKSLGEVELSAVLGVSRSPVREALRALETDGIVTSSPVNGRRVVAVFGVDDVYELYTVRLALEQLAHERAAERLDELGLARLREIVTQMRLVPADLPEGHVDQFALDFAFHDAVTAGAGLPRLRRILSGLWLQTRALLKQLDAAAIYPTADELIAVRRDHELVLAALETRESARAREAIGQHLMARRDALVRAVREHGGIR